MIKTDRYVQTEAAGMLYRLIPVTEEIIRCVIGKEEIKDWKSSGLSGSFIWKNRVEACGRNQVVHTG